MRYVKAYLFVSISKEQDVQWRCNTPIKKRNQFIYYALPTKPTVIFFVEKQSKEPGSVLKSDIIF
jgi:hypothetical protein